MSNVCVIHHARDAVAQAIKKYICGASDLPFVVYGQSGCGKTSIMAKAAELCWDWTAGKTVVLLRSVSTHFPGVPGWLATNCWV